MTWSWPKLPPKVVPTVRQINEVLSIAHSVLSTLNDAKDQGVTGKVLVAASFLNDVINLVVPRQTPGDMLLALGYAKAALAHDDFYVALLGEPATTETYAAEDEYARGAIVRYYEARGIEKAIAAITFVAPSVGGGFVGPDGPYVINGDKSLIQEVIRARVWADRPTKELVTVPAFDSERGRELTKLALRTMADSAPFIGQPPLSWYVERMRRYGAEHRAVRLVGPSGVGKTTLARAMGVAIRGESAKTLRLTSSVIDELGVTELLEVAELLCPDVLILDDYLNGKAPTNEDLAFLESLHKVVPLTVITTMEDGAAFRSQGLRSGRIDETFILHRPDLRGREELLSALLADVGADETFPRTLALATDGFSGADLYELVVRLRAHGTANYMDETARVRFEVGAAAQAAQVAQAADFDEDE